MLVFTCYGEIVYKMEWLFLLLFYGLSVYLKKRQQKAAHKEIEDDPEWDPDKKQENVKAVDLLEKFFVSQGLIEQENATKRKAFFLEQESGSENFGMEERTEIDFEPVSEEQITPLPENLEFIKRSEIERRVKDRRSIDQDHKPIKPFRRRDYVKSIQIFNSPTSLKQGIIIKEILCITLALRKNR